MLVLATCSLGWTIPIPLMLLDIFYTSLTLQNIGKAILKTSSALGITMYVFIVTALIFATIGVESFANQFVYDVLGAELEAFYDGKDNILRCVSVVECFKLVLYKAIPAGDMAAVMDDADRTGDKFESRMIFDLAFFIWVGLLLFNILTGKFRCVPLLR